MVKRLNSTPWGEKKGKRVFKSWDELVEKLLEDVRGEKLSMRYIKCTDFLVCKYSSLVVGHLCLLVGTYEVQVRFQASYRDWEVGTLTPSMFIFQRWFPASLRKISQGYKSGKKLGENLYYIFKVQRNICSCMFSKPTSLRNGTFPLVKLRGMSL